MFPNIFTWKTIRRGVYVFCTCSTFSNHVGGLIMCNGVSMLPTMQDGDIVFAERLSVRNRCLHRSDIVCVTSPVDRRMMLCKRLALKELDYVQDGKDMNPMRVPVGSCYVLGDNTEMSTDSRCFGPVPMGLVEMRVVLRLWPPHRAGWLSTHSFWVPED